MDNEKKYFFNAMKKKADGVEKKSRIICLV